MDVEGDASPDRTSSAYARAAFVTQKLAAHHAAFAAFRLA
jgi:hypothetical protein